MGAQELPEWARATDADWKAWTDYYGNGVDSLDQHACRVFSRMPKPEPADPVNADFQRLTNARKLTDLNGTVIDTTRPFWVKTYRYGWTEGLLHPVHIGGDLHLFVTYPRADSSWPPGRCILSQTPPAPHEGAA